MQFDEGKKSVGYCVVCNKVVPRRDVRDKGPVFCGRVHANLARFGTRYVGSNSGPMDRPSTEELMKKTKWKE